MKRIAVLALSAPFAQLFLGCASSPPSHFYSLTAVAPAGSEQASAASSPGDASSAPTLPSTPLVRVAAVHIPSSLDREEIVRRGSGNELEINGLDRWGAPLDEMVQRVLTEDLLERLPAGAVVLPSSPAPAWTDRIVVDILQFQSDADGAVVLEGSWSLLEPKSSTPSLIRNIRYSETASPAARYGDQAAAMSRMLGRLADEIVMSLPRH